jgi:predicted transglutaminase-like cysteine proteinase
LKWAVFFLLLLAGAVFVPSEFAAMGAAPGQDMETGATAQAGTQAAESVPAPQQAQPDQPGNETAIRQADQPLPAQSASQPVWRQGADSPERAEPEIRQPAPAQRTATPVWRQGASSGPETPTARVEGPKGSGDGQIRLFQSAAFRGNFNALPKWKRVLSKVKGEIQTLNNCAAPKTCPPGATSWQRIMKQAKDQERMEQLKMVNSFFNKWPYRLDQDAYGVSDWWATPQEFLKISGDCEDYAIIKYFALKELGFSQDDLRIVVVKDRIRGIAHAVLAVFTHGNAYILNNVSDAIFTHDKYRHYVPQYSLNEEHRWSHIPVAN